MTPDPYNHVRYQLLNAPVYHFPFPHVYVENVFPQEYYPLLLENLPEASQYTSLLSTGKVGKKYSKERFNFVVPDQLESLKEPKKNFWTELALWMGSEAFKKDMLAVFKSDANPQAIHSLIELIRDQTDYALQPHTDTPNKLISCIFYLPHDESQIEQGTSLFIPDESSFKLVKTVPFKPNSFFGFLRAPSSWHGVLPITQPSVRNSLSFRLLSGE